MDVLQVTVSDGITAVLGCSPEDVPRSRDAWRALLHPDDIQRVAAEYERGLRTGCYAVGYRLRRKDGRHIDVTDRGLTVKNDAGQLVRIFGLVVTSQKPHVPKPS